MPENKSHFDKIAEKYDASQASWSDIYAQITTLIEPVIRDKDVLDIGNGGHFSYRPGLAKSVTALDISPEMLRRLEAPDVRKVVGDARDLEELEDDSVDVILYVLCLHHIHGKSYRESRRILDGILAAAYRKLREGGSVIIVEPIFFGPLYFVEKLGFKMLRFALSIFNVPHIFFYSLADLTASISRNMEVPVDAVESVGLRLEGWVDFFGASFPGFVRLPARWWFLTKMHYLRAIKGKSESPSDRL